MNFYDVKWVLNKKYYVVNIVSYTNPISKREILYKNFYEWTSKIIEDEKLVFKSSKGDITYSKYGRIWWRQFWIYDNFYDALKKLIQDFKISDYQRIPFESKEKMFNYCDRKYPELFL